MIVMSVIIDSYLVPFSTHPSDVSLAFRKIFFNILSDEIFSTTLDIYVRDFNERKKESNSNGIFEVVREMFSSLLL